MRALGTTPKAKLEAFKLLRVFERNPVTFEKLMFDNPDASPKYAFEIIDPAFINCTFEYTTTTLPNIVPDTYKFPVYEFTLYRFDAERP